MQTIDYDSIEEKEAKDAPVDVATGVGGNSDAVDEPIAEVLDKVSVSVDGYSYQVPCDKSSMSMLQELKKKSRSKQRKQMLKKTKHGQPLMKYRIQKMLDVLQQ